MRAVRRPGRRGHQSGPSDDELADRLRLTFRLEAEGIQPGSERTRAILGVRPSGRTGSAGRRAVGPRRVVIGFALAALITGVVASVVINRPDGHPTQVGVIGPTSAPTAIPDRVRAAPTAQPRQLAVVPVGPSVAGDGEVSHPVGSGVASPVGASFVALSVTFVSSSVGWVLGTSSCGTGRCLALAHTTDGGSTWSADPQPQAGKAATIGLPVGAGGAHPSLGVRFADLDDGWIFGSIGAGKGVLWSTHDGGLQWVAQTLPGVGSGWIVGGLETTVGRVQAAVLTSSGPAVRLLTSSVTSDTWTVSATALPIGAGPVPSTNLLLQKAGGWVLVDNRTVVAGARLDGVGAWQTWEAPCRATKGPALLAAPTASSVIAYCDEGVWGPAAGVPAGTSVEEVYSSRNGGTTFQASGRVPSALSVQAVTAATAGVLVAGGLDGADGAILTSVDSGARWGLAYRSSTYTRVAQLGFETASQGVAIVQSAAAAELLMTFDGGQTWTPVDFQA